MKSSCVAVPISAQIMLYTQMIFSVEVALDVSMKGENQVALTFRPPRMQALVRELLLDL